MFTFVARRGEIFRFSDKSTGDFVQMRIKEADHPELFEPGVTPEFDESLGKVTVRGNA